MKAIGACVLYAVGWPLWLLACLPLSLAVLLVRVARPVSWLSRQCLARAREWDPRLWERGQHTDLRPPPGSREG